VSDHVLTVHFDDGERPYLTLQCQLSGADRPCAIVVCPVDHDDATFECIEEHGAEALDECWAEQWIEASGPGGLNCEALDPVSIPVRVYYDEGVVIVNEAS
jgi:hypothetical protein